VKKTYSKRSILKLNADYSVLEVINLKKAISLFLRDKINIIAIEKDSKPIHSSLNIKRPKAIALKKYIHLPRKTMRINRHNLWMRDGGICQYCKTPIKLKEMTIDHVVPKSSKKFPGHIWTNIVASCAKCNHKKGGKSLSQCNMSLIRKPFTPRYEDLIFFNKEIKSIFDDLSKKIV